MKRRVKKLFNSLPGYKQTSLPGELNKISSLEKHTQDIIFWSSHPLKHCGRQSLSRRSWIKVARVWHIAGNIDGNIVSNIADSTLLLASPPALFSTIQQYSSLFSTIQHYSALFITIQHYSALFSTSIIIMNPAQPSKARLRGVHSIFVLPHDLHITGTKKHFKRKLRLL